FSGSFLTTKLRGIWLWTIALPISECQLPIRYTEGLKIGNCQLAIGNSRFSVVLLQLPVESLAADAKSPGGVRFVAFGVVEGGLDCLAFDLFHRGRNGDFKGRCAAFAGGLGALDFDPIARFKHDFTDSFRQVFELNASTRSNNHRSFDRVFKLAHIAGPVVGN